RSPPEARSTPPIGRKTSEATLLAAISLLAVGAVRYPAEVAPWFFSEMFAIALSGFVAITAQRRKMERLRIGFLTLLIAIPIFTAAVARWSGRAIAMELTGLTLLGVASFALATGTRRPRAMGLVAAGFLTLFATVINDDYNGVMIAIGWMSVCVWHLVANHWEQVDLCSVENVSRGSGVRPMTVAAAVVLLLVGGWAAKDRFGASNRFGFGFMPTSGGSDWSDPAARSGVGTGDAAIAGVDKAESFGAVESDLFLESTDSTLFDMFSDSIGQPKKKNIWERRQGMTSEKVLEAHGRTSKTEKGGNSFSTDRMPPENHLHLNDSVQNAAVQWDGPSGIRLAMERFDTFDGVEWSNEAYHRNDKLTRVAIGEEVWFFDPKTMDQVFEKNQSEVQHGILKIIRLDSVRLPVPMMSSGVHIKQIDRQDFYAIDDDGSWFMPGRVRVPPLTVIHVASLQIMEDEFIAKLKTGIARPAEFTDRLTHLAKEWTDGHATPYGKLRSIVDHLRTDFRFDRSVGTESDLPVEDFLEQRSGGVHLFATTAALMAREIGLQSRLVSGFYVRPTAMEIAAGHSNVLPTDVHVWAEVRLSDGRWVEIEPTPGFREPSYRASWWLTSKRFAAKNWPAGVAALAVGAVLYATRLIWVEWLIYLAWWLASPLSQRTRLGFAMRIVEFRAKLLRQPRPKASPPRDWLLNDLLSRSDLASRAKFEAFCDVADRVCFGHAATAPDRNHRKVIDGVVSGLSLRTLRMHLAEETS
ncbi:MAG: transglutaminase domain-containing protein, partial [Planctomycetota bacterium]